MATPDVLLLVPSAAAYGFLGAVFSRTAAFGVAAHALLYFGVFQWLYYAAVAPLLSVAAVEAAAWAGAAVGVLFVTASGLPELVAPAMAVHADDAARYAVFGAAAEDRWPEVVPSIFLLVVSTGVLVGGIALLVAGSAVVATGAQVAMVVLGAAGVLGAFVLLALAHRTAVTARYGVMTYYALFLVAAAGAPALFYEQSKANNWFGSPQSYTAAMWAALITILVVYFLFGAVAVAFVDRGRPVRWSTLATVGYESGVGAAAVQAFVFLFVGLFHASFYVGGALAAEDAAPATVEAALTGVAIAAAVDAGILLVAWLVVAACFTTTRRRLAARADGGAGDTTFERSVRYERQIGPVGAVEREQLLFGGNSAAAYGGATNRPTFSAAAPTPMAPTNATHTPVHAHPMRARTAAAASRPTLRYTEPK